jgi:hypothetical protein
MPAYESGIFGSPQIEAASSPSRSRVVSLVWGSHIVRSVPASSSSVSDERSIFCTTFRLDPLPGIMASNTPEHHYQADHGSLSLGQPKVAIPRLQRVEQRHGILKDRRRVPRACTAVSLCRVQISKGGNWCRILYNVW